MGIYSYTAKESSRMIRITGKYHAGILRTAFLRKDY
eukprot:CAMPEP_0197345272 /NCGR_PEP_ID=MMETSP0893-20130614/3564_1 /TAXON_ID=44058 ORGANISM="Aureoumbra lagunensis, Strain CCMP1510" /NCGR_SAMPLE_ID=MMETSP0893 /ASSEMBLY_ACC=CAM_ASM_000539 /LENGTH=35 /DNA_ID= /DNA_START= /DNA_END= /DNA_ORIENTATION=